MLGTIEVILFSWVYGINKGFEEMHKGAWLRVPNIYRFVLKYITPLCLIILFFVWIWQDGVRIFFLEGVSAENRPYRWLARGLILATFLLCSWLVHLAWKETKNET